MKYLIVEDFSGQPVCFLFPRRVDHGDMRDQLPYGRVISAGFAELDDGRFLCSGGSLRARPRFFPPSGLAPLRGRHAN